MQHHNSKDQNAAAAKMAAQDKTIQQQGDELAALKAQMQTLLAAFSPAPASDKRGRGQQKEAEAA